MNKEKRPKKCVKCNSTRIVKEENIFYCKRCGFINKSMGVLNEERN